MAGLVPAIHVLSTASEARTWMPGSSPGMTWINRASTPLIHHRRIDHIGRSSLRIGHDLVEDILELEFVFVARDVAEMRRGDHIVMVSRGSLTSRSGSFS